MATNVQHFLRLKETIIQMNLEKDAAKEKADNIATLLKEAKRRQEQAEEELTASITRVKLRKEKLKATEKLLQDTTWELKLKHQDIRKRRNMIGNLKYVDTKSGSELQVAEVSLKQARGKAGESVNRLQDAEKKHQAMKRTMEICRERTRKADQHADLLEHHIVSGQARCDELSQTNEEKSEKISKQLETIKGLEREITQAKNRTESANRERLVKENEICRLCKDVAKHVQEKDKLLSTWAQMGNLANEY